MSEVASPHHEENKVSDVDEGFIEGMELKDRARTIPGRNMKMLVNGRGDKEMITTNGEHGQGTQPKENGAYLNDEEHDNENDDTQASDIVEVLQLTCPICGRTGEKARFSGRFCSNKCRAKNANLYRNLSQAQKKAYQRNMHMPKLSERNHQKENNFATVVEKDMDRNQRDLKIRFRLSSTTDNDNMLMRVDYKNSRTSPYIPSSKKRYSQFDWPEYLSQVNAIAAPPKAFREIIGKSPFPGTNRFKRGMALEGIDPKHQTLICALSVEAVQGYRIRLHFCGYNEAYDFWVNADSPTIFPCGFCEKTGRKLEPPKDVSPEKFKWEAFMKNFNLFPAPDEIFSIMNEQHDDTFKVGDKLEAVDKHNPGLVCVATIDDVIGQILLIHFDGWTHDYDYWCLKTSYLVHPVGWCEKKGRAITPPKGYTEPTFSWNKYLQETKSKAVSSSAFHADKRHSFKIGMKLEVVDKRNPILVRVGTIAEIKGFRMLIHFDGWSNIYDFWTDFESFDIHPAGWCSATKHALQRPVISSDLPSTPGQGGCPILGCTGIGHVKGPKYAGHHSEFGCPYSPQNLQGVNMHDRLSRPRLNSKKTNRKELMEDNDDEELERPSKRKKRTSYNLSPTNTAPLTNASSERLPINAKEMKTVVSSSEIDVLVDENGKSQYSAGRHSVFLSALSSFPNYDLPICWDQHSKILPTVKTIVYDEVSKWTVEQVMNFVEEVTGHCEHGEAFALEEIDGESLLLLKQSDIFDVLQIKLGPAVKIYNAILLIKAAEHLPHIA